MANKFDHRNDPEVQELLRALPPVKHPPLVGAADLDEVSKVLRSLPELEFPINSASELIEKLGGADKTFDIVGVRTDPMRMIKYMPAYYFPIASMENFIEKMAELVRSNRKQVDAPKELANIKRQLPNLRFPIANTDELLKMVGSTRRYTFQGRDVDPEQIMQRIPADMFPIQSQEDFDSKITRLMLNRPLIVKD